MGSLVALLAGLFVPLAVPAAAPAIDEFPLPNASSSPSGITAGPDGALWFTEEDGNRIGRITTAGTITEFTVPTNASRPSKIVAGPDGNLWFTENDGNQVGRLTTGGTFNEFSSGLSSGANPDGIVKGPDGNIWFTEFGAKKIGRITTGGTITETPALGSGGAPGDIEVGPDSRLWFLEEPNKIGAIDPQTRTINEFNLSAGTSPSGIAASSGALWFTGFDSNEIGRVATDGTVTNHFPTPTAGSQPSGIALGPDGALWFTETSASANKIGRMTTGGLITEFTIPTPSSDPSDIVAGPDGNLWFTEFNGNKIGRIAAGSGAVVVPPPPPAITQQVEASVVSLSVSPSKFRAARKGGSVSAKVGTTVRYTLSAAGTTRFSVERQTIGRKKGKKCVPQTRRNRRAKRCKRYVAVKGSFTHTGKAGGNSFTFTGRIKNKRLRPGRYQLVAVVPSTGTKPKRAAFKIIRG